MVIAFFIVNDKEEKTQFFKNTFLLADINIDFTHRMFFFTLNNIKVNFTDQKPK